MTLIFTGRTNKKFYLVTKEKDKYRVKGMYKEYEDLRPTVLTEEELFKDFEMGNYSEQEVKLMLAL